MAERLTIQLGHDVRQWTTFVIDNPSEITRAIFAGVDDEAQVAHLKLLDEQGAARVETWTTESNPDYFADYATPSVVGTDWEETPA